MVADLGAGMDEVGMLDLQLPADPADLIVFAGDDRLVGRRHREETPQQAKSLLEGRNRGELTRHDQVVCAAEAAELVESQRDDRLRLCRRERSLLRHETQHQLPLFGADRMVGVGNAAEQVCEGREVPGAPCVQMTEHARDGVDHTRRVRRLLETEPSENVGADTHAPYSGSSRSSINPPMRAHHSGDLK
jgi:hypothetical protein